MIGNPVEYTVDTSGNLTSVKDRALNTTDFVYGTEAGGTPPPAQAHHLTSVVDPRDVTTLRAAYDALGRLTPLTGAADHPASVGFAASDGSRGRQTVSDLTAQHNTTESIYDDRGNVVREIRSLIDGGGTLTGYSVTVHEYSYYGGPVSGELTDIFLPRGNDRIRAGASNQNLLTGTRDYQPFVIDGTDAQRLRYSTPPTTLAREVEFHVPIEPAAGDPDFGQIGAETVYVAPGVGRRTTYENYSFGQPQKVTDPYGNVSQFRYDEDTGNLLLSINALGEGTENEYTPAPANPATGVPGGLLTRTYRVLDADGDLDTDPQRLSLQLTNEYYGRRRRPRWPSSSSTVRPAGRPGSCRCRHLPGSTPLTTPPPSEASDAALTTYQ